MSNIVINDEIVKDDWGRPDLRKIELDIDYKVLSHFLKDAEEVSCYSEINFHTTFTFWTKDFLTSATFYDIEGNTIIHFYPYDKMEWLAKDTGRDYIKEKDECAKWIIKFAKKVKKLKVE
jgi:hypothetical protein